MVYTLPWYVGRLLALSNSPVSPNARINHCLDGILWTDSRVSQGFIIFDFRAVFFLIASCLFIPYIKLSTGVVWLVACIHPELLYNSAKATAELKCSCVKVSSVNNCSCG